MRSMLQGGYSAQVDPFIPNQIDPLKLSALFADFNGD